MIALEQDKPIMLNYYEDTKEGGTSFLGEDKDANENLLVRSDNEYTSPVIDIIKAKEDYIVVTENSVYIVNGAIKKMPVHRDGM